MLFLFLKTYTVAYTRNYSVVCTCLVHTAAHVTRGLELCQAAVLQFFLLAPHVHVLVHEINVILIYINQALNIFKKGFTDIPTDIRLFLEPLIASRPYG